MSEAMKRTGLSWQAKTVCRLLAFLTATLALTGCILSALGQRTKFTTGLIVASIFSAMGLCAILLHRYDARADQAGMILHKRVLCALMIHTLFVAIAALLHTADDAQRTMVIAIALADAALAATAVFLFAGIRGNWEGTAKIWVWLALQGGATFVLRLLGADWMACIVIAAPAVAVVIAFACKPSARNSLCNPVFALAVVILALVLLLGRYVPKIQMISYVFRLMLTPIYALTIFLMDDAISAGSADKNGSRCVRSGKTLIYNHVAANAADNSGSDLEPAENMAAEAPLVKDDPEGAADPSRILARNAGEKSVSNAPQNAENNTDALKETDGRTNALEAVDSDRDAPELNCDTAFRDEYRLLSLKYLSIAPLDAFAGITGEQVACMESLGVHTLADLASLPIFRMAAQIEQLATREENESAGS